MPKIADLIAQKKAANEEWVSYEYFPPRSREGMVNLEARFERMKQAAKPLFVDMTWGAGGSTSEATIDLTLKMKKLGLEPNMHLTCTNVAQKDVEHALATCRSHGVQNIVALRGDPPVGQEKWAATDGGFNCALDLVKFIRSKHGSYFNLSVAGYPEGHPDVITEVAGGLSALSASEKTRCRVDEQGAVFVCRDAAFAAELAYLKAKCDAGADAIITQMFFDVSTYATFCEQCVAAGILVPVIPGIMLLQAAAGFKKMTGFCKTRVPKALADKVNELEGDDAAVKAYGIELGHQICLELRACGAPGLHFYTLNLEKTTLGIVGKLGMLDAQRTKKKETKDSATFAAFAFAAFTAVVVAIVANARSRAQ